MINSDRTTDKRQYFLFRKATSQTVPFRKRALFTTLSVLLMGGIFLINTSYHSRYETSQLIETQYFLPELTLAMEEALGQPAGDTYLYMEGTGLSISPLVREYYGMQGFMPSFTTYDDLNDKGRQMLDLLESARNYGLEPESYRTDVIRDLQQQLQDPDLKQAHVSIRRNIELLMADAAFRFMSHLHSGYLAADSAFFCDPYTMALPGRLITAMSDDDIAGSILACQPEFIEYARLQHAAELFLQRVDLRDTWVDLNAAGEDSVRLWQNIREVLDRLGYVVTDRDDASLAEALKIFQLHRGLEPDGRPGQNTIEALSQSSLHLYRTLALNMDRMRKQAYSTEHALYVNIPSYQLKVIRENQVQQVYRVCVGRTYSPTPRIDGNIEKIITNPEWNVPSRIARVEMLPKIRSNADYLAANRISVLDSNYRAVNASTVDWNQVSADDFPYFLQQSSGADNSLGQVKFMFQNNYSVYLHDTPSKSLFDKDIRAYSHGCVRVEHPDELAAYLVEQLQTEPDDVRELIRRGIRREINLQHTIPVQIRYITCEGDDEGMLYCYKDIYGLDAKEMDTFLEMASL